VLSQEPHSDSNLESHVLPTSILWVPYLGFQQVLLEKPVTLCHSQYCSILLVFLTLCLTGLSVAWIALVGGSGSWSRMVWSALSDEWNCCKQTVPKITAWPSYPAHRCRRPVSTSTWSGFAILSGHQSVDRKQSTVFDWRIDMSKLVSSVDWWTPFRDR